MNMDKFEYEGGVTVFYYGTELSVPTTDGEEFGDDNLADILSEYAEKYSVVKFAIEGVEVRENG